MVDYSDFEGPKTSYEELLVRFPLPDSIDLDVKQSIDRDHRAVIDQIYDEAVQYGAVLHHLRLNRDIRVRSAAELERWNVITGRYPLIGFN